MSRIAKVLANALPPAPRQVAGIDQGQAALFAKLGTGFLSQADAVRLWNTSVMAGQDKAPLICSALGAGAVIAAVDDVVTKLCGPPPDPANPFAALPEWASELFKRLGVIPPPAAAPADPDAPPKPVESRAELEARAADAGIHLA